MNRFQPLPLGSHRRVVAVSFLTILARTGISGAKMGRERFILREVRVEYLGSLSQFEGLAESVIAANTAGKRLSSPQF
jgi:hypothetical protein